MGFSLTLTCLLVSGLAVHSPQYLLCGPLVAKAVGGRAWERASPDHWCFLLSLLFFLRAATYRLWAIFTNMLFLNRRRVIARDGVDFQQIDKEWHW